MEKRREKTNKNASGLIKGAVIIATGGFIAKIIGALYRIPLTNIIGGHGIGLYQMVYPVYCILLTVSATGIPSSIAKLTAERVERGESTLPLLKKALILFLCIGLAGSLIMVVSAPFLSKAQGSEEVLGGYFTLAPAVLFTSAISVFRGWFQGQNKMYPTALSEILEQVVKVGFGLLFAYLYRDNLQKAVIFLLLSVSISELFALFLMIFLFRRIHAPMQKEKQGGRVALKSILRLSIPVTFSAILFPVSSMIDSVLAVRFIGAYSADAVALYGLFSGGAVTIINLPVSICYGIAAASVPSVASATEQAKERAKAQTQGKENEHEKEYKEKGKNPVRKRILFSLFLTVAIALPCAVGLYLFAEPAVKIVFRNLKGEERTILIALVKTFSLSALTLSCVQTLSACLTAQGKPKLTVVSTLLGVAVKTAVECILLPKPEISVFALAHATNLCYIVAFFLNLIYNMYISKNAKVKRSEQ